MQLPLKAAVQILIQSASCCHYRNIDDIVLEAEFFCLCTLLASGKMMLFIVI
jgi:hypothetical protein